VNYHGAGKSPPHFLVGIEIMAHAECIMCGDQSQDNPGLIFVAGSFGKRDDKDVYFGICENCVDECQMIVAEIRRNKEKDA